MIKSNSNVLFLVIASVASQYPVSTHINERETAVYCNQVIDSQSASYVPASVQQNGDFVSGIYYTGSIEGCLLDQDHVLRIDLERVSRVSDIGIDLVSLRNGSADELNVTLTRYEASDNNSIQFSYPYFDTDTISAYFKYCNPSTKPQTPVPTGALVSSIEISANKVISINPSVLRISVIRKDHENQQDYSHQCSAPGKYRTQILDKSQEFFKVSDRVNYCCNERWNYSSERTCTVNGSWTGNTPRCPPSTSSVPKNEILVSNVTIRNELEGETSYYLNQDYYGISRIVVELRTGFSECTYGNFDGGISLFENGIPKDASWYLHSPWHKNQTCRADYVKYYTTDSDLIDTCTNCTVKLKFKKKPQLTSAAAKFTITGWSNKTEYETYEWMRTGCPPIDPYIGMPDEYAGETYKNRSELNRKLRETPCRDGYRLVSYDTHNPRRCDESNSWTGDTPKCELVVTCRTPPSIENGHWRYMGNSLYNKVRYTCQESFQLVNGNEIVNCNQMLNKWEGVPTCQRVAPESQADVTSAIAGATHSSPAMITSEPRSSMHQLIPILVGIIALLLLLVATLAGALLINRSRRNRRNDITGRQASINSYKSVRHYDDGGYVQPMAEARRHSSNEYCEIDYSINNEARGHVYDTLKLVD